MEDVFDTTGRPPSGWMHAVFHGGPYGDDTGRCIPGPPAPEFLEVPLPEGGEHVYRLWKVGSWSDPDDPVAVYDPDVPPAPPGLLTDQERTWLRKAHTERGEDPVRLVAIDSRGIMVRRPTESAIGAMLAGLGRGGGERMVLQRLDDGLQGDRYVQVLLCDDGTYGLEHRAGTGSEHCRSRALSRDEVLGTLLGWAADAIRVER
ncbi:hypothetical protein Slala03_44660 [Streptomyces lavendulae subsp. lavendulae]|uniref:hypothetical protein n=1 Tax=Streptomyces lavendulae TaxID=1914 RepID=UPI0024A20878|nr:hypothetical protein [Streptomyces lavendulae]GLV84777.1 hypothetical protein Slala03_44660 [Streptomyces lavendulae subsp. lavendulae]